MLSESVRTFYEKQIATEFTRRVAGVVSVVNLIDVKIGPRAQIENGPSETG